MRRAKRTVRRGSDAGRSDLQVIGQLLIFSKRYAVLAFEHKEISAAINKSLQEEKKKGIRRRDYRYRKKRTKGEAG